MNHVEIERKLSQRKRSGVSHCYATKDGWLIMSNGFDYDFYKYELIGQEEDRNALILEQNFAYEQELSK